MKPREKHYIDFERVVKYNIKILIRSNRRILLLFQILMVRKKVRKEKTTVIGSQKGEKSFTQIPQKILQLTFVVKEAKIFIYKNIKKEKH